MTTRLRVFRVDDAEPIAAPKTVPMRVSEFVELLGDAKDTRRTWLSDFRDDEITIPADLYDVLVSYGRLPRGA